MSVIGETNVEAIAYYALKLFEEDEKASILLADVIYSLRDKDLDSIEELLLSLTRRDVYNKNTT